MGNNYKLIHGDCLEALLTLEDNSVDSIVTDPPGGIAFMGKNWDKDKGGRDAWIAWMEARATECLRVLKPGGHALVWAIPRTSHWTATAWENAGFEVRDRISHIFGSGFPKSHDISKAIDRAAGVKRKVGILKTRPDGTQRPNSGNWKNGMGYHGNKANEEIHTIPATPEAAQWEGWGTALKPAMEDWWLLRKPLSEPTIAKNVLRWGTGGLNIDGCRIEGKKRGTGRKKDSGIEKQADGCGTKKLSDEDWENFNKGRWPAHLTHDGSDEVLAGFPVTGGGASTSPGQKFKNVYQAGKNWFYGIKDKKGRITESGSAARFFYCSKASKADRTENGQVDNRHPTVKPYNLMRWLCRLITPPGGIILDPFCGSGSTGKAAINEGFGFIGIEQEAESFDVAEVRLQMAQERQQELESIPEQLSIYFLFRIS